MSFDFLKMLDLNPALIVVWAFVSFFVWYFYRHSSKKYRVGFKAAFLSISALFFFIILVNGYKHRLQPDPQRIVIFPFANQSDSSSSISWESLAFSEISTRYLEQINLDKMLPYSLDNLTSAANRDSLIFSNYCLEFAKRINLDYVVLGHFQKEPAGHFLKYRLIQVGNNRTVFDEGEQITLNEIQKFCRKLSISVAKSILEPSSRFVLRDEWHSVEQIKAFFGFKHFYLNGEFEAAFDLAQNAVKDDSSSNWLNSLAEIYLNRAAEKKKNGQNELEDFKMAKSLLVKSVSIDEGNHKTLRLLAELYLANERWHQAEKYLRKSLLINHWYSKTYIDFAQLHPSRYVDLGFDNENDLLEKAIFINSLDFDARLILADNYSGKNRSDLAIKKIKEILYINPNRVDALMKLGNIYMMQNDLLNSLEIYHLITELEPENGEVYYNLGIVYYHQKDYDTAIKFFKHAIKSVNNVDSHLYLAYIYEQQDKMELAIEHLRSRITRTSGRNDKFAEEARKRLYQIMSDRETDPLKVSETTTEN